MARSVNQVILIGDVSGSPEVKRDGDTTTCRLTLVSRETYQNQDGEEVERKERHSVVARGALAKDYSDSLTAGTRICVDGAIETRNDLKSGDRGRIEVRADELKILEGASAPASDPNPEGLSAQLTSQFGSPVNVEEDGGDSSTMDHRNTDPSSSGSAKTGDEPSPEKSNSSSSSSGYSSPFPPPRSR